MQAANSIRADSDRDETLSVNNGRTSLPRPAPTASRIAIPAFATSPRKLAGRNIAQAISRSNPTAPKAVATLRILTRDGDIEIFVNVVANSFADAGRLAFANSR